MKPGIKRRFRSDSAVELPPVTSHWSAATHQLTLTYTHAGLDQVAIGAGGARLLLLIADTRTAERFWVAHTADGPLLAEGSTLLRSAVIHGRRANLTGDAATAQHLTIWAPPRVRAVTWDRRRLAVRPRRSGALVGMIPGPAGARLTLPSLTRGWRFAFGSPERLPGFNDRGWPVADHPVTDNPIQPTSTPVLYAQDYGYDHGFVLYRGHFTGTSPANSVALTADTGPFGSFAVWLNGWLMGRYINNLDPQNTFYLPQGLLRTDGHNTLAIAEWSLSPGAGGLGRVSLVPYEVLRGGIPVQPVASPG